ncbi:MAG TPA: hypothetical protein VGY98_03210 [Verrucomicrobiae bacterium]|nr:hypothetical protein [Verrucomicrobiae bacterium]
MNLLKSSLFALAATAILCLTGCSTGPSAWNIKVTQITPGSIQVDLVGITESEKTKWEAYSMDSYWNNEDDPRRANALKLTHFLELNKPWIVSKDDPIWQKWFSHGDTELAIIANLPGNFPPGPGDPRLNFYPLDKGSWKAKKHTLVFEVQNTIVNPVTPQKSK